MLAAGSHNLRPKHLEGTLHLVLRLRGGIVFGKLNGHMDVPESAPRMFCAYVGGDELASEGLYASNIALIRRMVE
jgi:hypothetical protein